MRWPHGGCSASPGRCGDPAVTVLTALGWSALAASAVWRHRPSPARVAALVASRRPVVGRIGVVESIGRHVRLAVSGSDSRRGATADEADVPGRARHDQVFGLAAVAVVVLVVISPVLAVALAGAVAFGGRSAGRRARRRLDQQVIGSLPEVIDLFMLAAGSGRSVASSVTAVAGRAVGPLADELRAVVRRVELGERMTDALAGAAAVIGDPIRPLVAALTASERHGTALVPALDQLASEARLDRRRRAEEAARKVPVKLLFPLVLCTLPAFALLTVVPLLAGALGSLRV